MSHHDDDFECPYTPNLTKYIVDNFCAKRREYAEQEAMDYPEKCDFMEASVKIKLDFNQLNSSLHLESDLPELPARLDVILQVYASGRLRKK